MKARASRALKGGENHSDANKPDMTPKAGFLRCKAKPNPRNTHNQEP